MVLAIVLWCSVKTDVLIANKPHDLATANEISAWAEANPNPSVKLWRVIRQGDALWQAALDADDPQKPARRCHAAIS